ncbi:MAG: hypothetical protein QOJ29_2910 [Thermoleophilaceae bacterium]|jgi:phosphoglycolate phosphatase-like HAD superfamily hydrolase|nr:hypothetical protein [Thermoleophilaceae bacterium]
MSRLRAIVLDFDGVVLESADIKTRAFETLFAEHEDHVTEIVDLHLRLAGVSRYEKFRMIYADILELPLSDEQCEALGERFSQIALEQILAAPFVAGAREFIAGRAESQLLFIGSGTPQDELRNIVKARGLEPYFCGVYGTPETKHQILVRIMAEHRLGPDSLVFVGDAMTDFEGAREAGVPFIGRVPQGLPSPFPEAENVPLVEDLAELERAIDDLLPVLARQAG